MSPTLLAICRRVELDTRRLAGGRDEAGATYPRDYHRPAALLALWRGPGRFWYGS